MTREKRERRTLWKDEDLIEEAKKYSTKQEMREKDGALRKILQKKGLYIKATSHMKPLKNRDYYKD